MMTLEIYVQFSSHDQGWFIGVDGASFVQEIGCRFGGAEEYEALAEYMEVYDIACKFQDSAPA